MSIESIKIGKNSFKGNLLVFTGKQGDFIVSYIPSLNISGYGKSESEANEDIEYNLKVYLEDLIEQPESIRIKELISLGWERSAIFQKKYARSFVDELGVLNNFDSPKDVRKTFIETPA